MMAWLRHRSCIKYFAKVIDATGNNTVRVRDWIGDKAREDGTNLEHEIIRSGMWENRNLQPMATSTKPVIIKGKIPMKHNSRRRDSAFHSNRRIMPCFLMHGRI